MFTEPYAESYDWLYQEKAYDLECDVLERLMVEHEVTGRRILDLGCGTGAHALRLASRGYAVVGVDRAETMLAHARRKTEESLAPVRPAFVPGDLRSVALDQRFHAVLMMFTVLGYQLENEDILAAFETARRHLLPGGVIIFDVWHGPAVLAERPSERIKKVTTEDGQIIRAASGLLDTMRNRCRVDYHLWRIQQGRLTEELEESHWIRYFFPLELDLFLRGSGLERVRLSVFPEIDQEPSDATWTVVGVARSAV